MVRRIRSAGARIGPLGDERARPFGDFLHLLLAQANPPRETQGIEHECSHAHAAERYRAGHRRRGIATEERYEANDESYWRWADTIDC